MQKGIDILREDGVRRFIQSVLRRVLPINRLRKYKYKIQYGAAAPCINEIIQVPTEDIQFTLPSSECPYRMPQFGIMSGDWDQYKQPIEKSFITKGLKQKFVEGSDWEDTEYYDAAVRAFDSKEEFTPLDSYEQSENGLMSYFQELENLFNELNTNGFKDVEDIPASQLPKVHIGRGGEFILTHGHHRTVMCDIIGIDTIPARVGIRHTKWQSKRIKVFEAKSECFDHPDLNRKL